MHPPLNLLYRGSLSSCNYSCGYCPFAKTRNTRAELRRDFAELERFVDWAGAQERPLRVLFTPWGEALGHRAYRRALVDLSRMPHVQRVAMQTNLSAPLGDLASGDPEALALWATFHPSQTPLPRFLSQCRTLDALGLRYSVGVVGLREHLSAVEDLRRALPPRVYVWVNAYKRVADYYSLEDLALLRAVDPYLGWNLRRHPSLGRPCAGGEKTLAVDGRGDLRRCHFLPEVLGNLYDADWASCLQPRACPAATCGCHIGYVHLRPLGLERLYGEGLLERLPTTWPAVEGDFVLD